MINYDPNLPEVLDPLGQKERTVNTEYHNTTSFLNTKEGFCMERQSSIHTPINGDVEYFSTLNLSSFLVYPMEKDLREYGQTFLFLFQAFKY
jgi:hypothetical protein